MNKTICSIVLTGSLAFSLVIAPVSAAGGRMAAGRGQMSGTTSVRRTMPGKLTEDTSTDTATATFRKMAPFNKLGDKRCLVREENGVIEYSVDGGETWSQEKPEGFAVPSRGVRIKIKEEDGVKYYSTDDGETWSQEKPELPNMPEQFTKIREASKIQTKEEDGVKYYSTDEGETWNEIKPGSFTEARECMPLLREGLQECMPLLKGGRIQVKEEDGTKYFSTDGGETWDTIDSINVFNFSRGNMFFRTAPAVSDGASS